MKIALLIIVSISSMFIGFIIAVVMIVRVADEDKPKIIDDDRDAFKQVVRMHGKGK